MVSLNHRRLGAASVEFEWGADTHWNAAPWGSRYRRGLPSVGAREGRDQFCLRSPPACVSLSTPDSDRDVGAMAKSTFPLDSLLTALPADLSSALFAKAHDVSLAADQIVFLAGDAGDGCYRIEDGLLKVSVSAAGGGERILAILGPGSIVGELSMIDGAPRSASVSALRDSKLRFVSRAAFEAFGRSNPDVYRHVMILLARRLRDTNDALAATSFLPVKGRVARALLNLAEAFGRDVGSGRIVLRQKVTQSDLGCNGRHCTRKCQPDPEGMDGPFIGQPPRGLLLPGK